MSSSSSSSSDGGISKGQILDQMEQLSRQKQEALDKAQQIEGAMRLCRHWLARLERQQEQQRQEQQEERPGDPQAAPAAAGTDDEEGGM